MGYFPLTGDRVIDGMTHGFYWKLGPDRTVDWSVSGGLFGEGWRDPAGLANEISLILTTYSYYANIKFNFVGYYSNPVAAASAGSEIDITLSTGYPFSSSSTWAMGFFPDSRYTAYFGQPGDVFLNVNSDANFLPSYAPGSQGWFLFLHEIGHTLGLKHPHDDGGTGRPTLDQIGLGVLNDDWGTVMSYNDDFQWNNFNWDPATPMILDALALQYIYGPNMSTNAGDTTFTLARTGYYMTLWDAGGTDIVSAASASEGWLILLPSAQPSRLVDTKVGLAVPLADAGLTAPTTLYWLAGDMEAAAGSASSDILVGSDDGNVLIGNGGNDSMDGGGGIDYSFYSGARSQYSLARNSDGSWIVSGLEGVDRLNNIERLTFGATKVALDIDGDAGQAYRLYQAAFDRTPDTGGLGFWINAIDNGVKLVDVAASFISSAEFQTTYGSLDTAHFVMQLYENVLHRGPDSSGLAFWENILDTAAAGRADVLAAFSESPENQANVIGQISGGIVYT
jgi:serralysin